MAHNAAVAATVGSSIGRKPPALTMPYSTGGQHTRHLSSASSNSDGSDSPALSALDSSAALILVHDQDEPSSPFEFTDDEDDQGDDEQLVSPMFEVRKSAVFPPLPPSLVFLYLLVPYLRLGALNLPYSQLPLKYGLPALLLLALASVYARQIWYMLARYLRKANMADVLLDTFARGRGKERQRDIIRAVVRVATGVVSTLLSVIYLRYSMYTLHPLLPDNHHPTLSYVYSTSLVAILVGYLAYARSLNYKRVIVSTWLSLATYVAWLGCILYAHTQGILDSKSGWLGSGTIWPGLATTAFAFCSSSTLPLYASLKSTSHPISTGKSPKSRSFRILSLSSAAIAVLLLLPSVIFAAFPNRPASVSPPFESPSPTPVTSPSPLPLNATHVHVVGAIPSLPTDITLPTIQVHTLIRIFASASLILGIPSIIVTTPPLAIPSLRSAKFNVSRVITIIFVFVCALVPPGRFPDQDNKKTKSFDEFFFNSSGIFAVVIVIVLFMTFTSTFFVPAFIHISTHFFKRPLAIVVPPRTPLLHTPSDLPVDNGSNAIAGPSRTHQSSPRMIHDELLLRKERALQKKQFKKRIVWDIGVWLLLFASVAGVVGAFGRLAGAW